ncbi:MAG: cytochrome-c peroxidase [bacterium]
MKRLPRSLFLPAGFVAALFLMAFSKPGTRSTNVEATYPDIGPLPELEAPEPAKVELGKLLFFDVRLSGDASLSCASCHQPENGWTDARDLSLAYPGSKYFRNTQTVLNMAYKRYFYWDGRLTGKDRDTQVRDKITETHFMNLDGRLMMERLKQVPEYVEMFQRAFGGEPSFGRTLKAVAAFEQTLVSQNVPFDTGKMSRQARHGMKLFKGKAGCIRCHNGPMFTDNQPHKIGVQDHPELLTDAERATTFRSVMKFLGVPNFENLRTDPGFFAVSKMEQDLGKFVTPSLREVAITAPYMHNGVFHTLQAVIEFYNKGGGDGAELEPLNLSQKEKEALVAFLESLSGDEIVMEAPVSPDYQVISNWREVPN